MMCLKHFSTANQQAVSAKSSSASLAKIGVGNSEEALRAKRRNEEKKMQVLHAEALFVQFVAENYPSFRTGDH